MSVAPPDPRVNVIADYACHVGEGPLWHAREKSLYWVDILSPRIFRYDSATARNTEYLQDRPVGGFTVQGDGSLLLFRDRGNVVTWRDGKTIATIVESIATEDGQRFNDVIADPQGRVFAGTLTSSSDGDDVAKRTGRLYRFERDGSFSVLFDGIGISNGMGFSPDLKRFYFIDSFDGTIWQFDYERATGQIDNRRLIRQIDRSEGCPDGMTVDSEGNLWIAMVFSGCVMRCRPDGTERQRLAMPTSFITSATFGGEDYSRLFVTSGMGNEKHKFGELAGATFSAATDVRGRPEFVSRIGKSVQ